MAESECKQVAWYEDAEAVAQGVPSMVHSYVAAAATAINAQEGSVDLVWLAGATAFAFRIWVHKELCPSATSVIDWFMPVGSLRQAGWSAQFFSRLWWEGKLEEERREQANAACREALAAGRLPVCWDICFEPEWAVIDALNDDGTYACLAAGDRTTTFDPARMGRRAVEIMSVTIIGERTSAPWDRSAIVVSLRSAVNHARQGETILIVRPVLPLPLPRVVYGTVQRHHDGTPVPWR